MSSTIPLCIAFDAAPLYYRYPEYLSDRLVTLLKCLMTYNVHERLSSLEAVQNDPFFFEIDSWRRVESKSLRMPFEPMVDGRLGYNPEYLDSEMYDRYPRPPALEPGEEEYGFFRNFDYVHKSVAKT